MIINNKTPVGEVRPSQLLWTYGPGALIDLPSLSVVTQGIDHWDKDRCQLGCSACYGVFADGLSGMLKNMHKGTAHIGKSPAAFHKIREHSEKMKSLQDRLNQAVAAEEYERAADLRDQIRQIEAGISA